MQPFDAARRLLFGDDVFISYSRRQGADYALALAGRLTREGLSCFLDQWGTRPGRDLPPEVRQALRRSTMLVIVGSDAAGMSENVQKEIEEFLPTNRSIVPITFVGHEHYGEWQSGASITSKGTIERASWYSLIDGVALTIEAMEARQPSSNVVDRIVNAEGFTRRNKRLRNAFWSTLGAVVLLAVVGWSIVRNASKLASEATKRQRNAEVAANHANQKMLQANGAAQVAVNLRNQANQQRLIAEQLQRRATSERLATQAQSFVAAFPQRSLALAMMATKTFADHPGDPGVVAAEQALWDALSQNGGIPVKTPSWVTASAVSADGRWLATGGANEVVLADLRFGVPPQRRQVLPLDSKQDPADRGSVGELMISPDSRWLLARMSESLRVWDLHARNPAASPVDYPDADLGSATAGFTPDSRWMVRVGGLSATAFNMRSKDPRKGAIQLGDISLTDFLTAMANPEPENSEEKRAAPAEEGNGDQANGQEQPETNGVDVSIPVATSDLRWLVVAGRSAPPTLLNISSADSKKSEVILEGFRSNIERVAVSPNRQWVAVVSDGFNEQFPNSTAYLWKLDGPAKTAAPIVLKGHNGKIDALEFSPDGCWLATGGHDHTARLWKLTQEDPSEGSGVLDNHVGPVTHLAFSADGKWLATGGHDVDEVNGFRDPKKQSVQIWPVGSWFSSSNLQKVKLSSFNLQKVKMEPGHVNRLFFSPDSQWLVATVKAQTGDRGTEEGRPATIGQAVHLWRMTDSEAVVLRGHENPVTTASFTADSRWLVTGAADGLRFWRLFGERNWFGAPETTINVGRGEIAGILVSADGRWLVTTTETGQARLWDLKLDAAHAHYTVVGAGDYRVEPISAFSPDARWLIAASRSKESSQFDLRLYDLRARDAGVRWAVLGGHEGPVNVLDVSHDSRWLVTNGADGTVRLWDLTAHAPARSSTVLPGYRGKALNVTITPDCRWIAVIDETAIGHLWRLGARGVKGKPFDLRGHKQGLYRLTASPDSRWLATVSRDGTARLWDLMAPNPAHSSRIIKHHNEWNNPIVFSPDGRWFVTAHQGMALLEYNGGEPVYVNTYETGIWDASSPDHPVVTFKRSEDPVAVFSSDSKWLVTRRPEKTIVYERGDLALWNVSKLPTLGAPVMIGGGTSFSPDSRWLIAGRSRWDLQSDDIPNSRIDFPITSVRSPYVVRTGFTPDSRIVLLGIDNWLAFYPLRLEDLMATATEAIYRNLSEEEWKSLFPREPYRKVFPAIP